MGVKSCSRKDCDNIMCDGYAISIGYVCNDCIDEIRNLQKSNHALSIIDVKKFLKTPKEDIFTQPMLNIDKLFGLE